MSTRASKTKRKRKGDQRVLAPNMNILMTHKVVFIRRRRTSHQRCLTSINLWSIASIKHEAWGTFASIGIYVFNHLYTYMSNSYDTTFVDQMRDQSANRYCSKSIDSIQMFNGSLIVCRRSRGRTRFLLSSSSSSFCFVFLVFARLVSKPQCWLSSFGCLIF